MYDQFSEHLLEQRGDIVLAVQKYSTSELYIDLHPLSDSIRTYPAVELVENEFSRFDETLFFILYK